MTRCLFVVNGGNVTFSIEADAPIISVAVSAHQSGASELRELRLAAPEPRFLGNADFKGIAVPDRVTIVANFPDGTDDSHSSTSFKQNQIEEVKLPPS